MLIIIAIDNWEDIEILCGRERAIEILCGRDRATDIGVEHMDDTIEVTAEKGENEVNYSIAQHSCQYLLSTSSTIGPHQRKK